MNQPDLSATPRSGTHSDVEIEVLAEKIALSAREMSAEIDRERRLPDELVAQLREAGLLRAGMPREVQAPELAPGLALRCAARHGEVGRWRCCGVRALAVLQRDYPR